jgi:hypothetical protein
MRNARRRSIADWLPQPAQLMCFRVAVRELESWLLADAEALAAFSRHPQDLDPRQRRTN